MKFAAGNAQHVGARPRQEDAFGFSDPTNKAFTEHAGFLGVVADGMGGMSGGREASQMAVRTFLRAYQAKAAAESIPDALLRSVVDSNNAVLSLSDGVSEQTSGTTLAAALVHNDLLYWISTGDSRIYLLRDGQLTRLTADHIYGRELDEKAAEGKISRTEARSHPERGSLTSYLGMKKLPELDRSVRPFPLNPRDCVILCTDGLYRALSELEIAATFHEDLHGACDALLRRALEKRRAQQDNLTVIALSNELGSAKYLGTHKRRSSRIRSIAITAGLLIFSLIAAGAWHWRQTLADAVRMSGQHSDDGSELPITTPATHRLSSENTTAERTGAKAEVPTSAPNKIHQAERKSAQAKTPGVTVPESDQSVDVRKNDASADATARTPAKGNESTPPPADTKGEGKISQSKQGSEPDKPAQPKTLPSQSEMEEKKEEPTKIEPIGKAPEPAKSAGPEAAPPPRSRNTGTPNTKTSQNPEAASVNSNKKNPVTKAVNGVVQWFKNLASDSKPDKTENPK